MAKIPRIQFKRTKTPGTKPSKDILAEGELAINLADRTLFTKSGDDVIDLGFAKGGIVNGDIIQETGNITSNGTVSLKTNIDIKNNVNDNKIFRLSYEGDRALLSVNEGDNKWKTILVPLDEDGTKTIATRQWVNTFVKSGTIQTDLKAPDNTSVLTINNSKLLSFKDGTTDIFAVDIKGGYMRNSLILSGQNDYPGITLQKNDTFKVRIETDTDSSNTLLAFAYRDSGNSNKFVIKMPKEPGTRILATQNWVDATYYKRDDSPTFKGQVNIGDKGGNSNYAQLSYESGEARWSVNTGSWKILKHPNENGTVSTREWVNNFLNRTGADTYIQSADGKHWLTIVNDGMFSVWHNDTKQRSFYVETNGAAVAAHSVRAPGIMATRGANELIKLGFNATGSPFLSYFDSAGKWTAYYFPNTNGGTVASQEWTVGQFYKKGETYNKSEIDGKVNGRLTQAQGDARYALSNLYQSEGGESRVWNGAKTHYLFTNNNANSGLFKQGTGYIWGFNAGGQMTAGLVPVGCGGTGAKEAGAARANLSVYSKAETDGRYPLKADVYAKSATYSRAEVDSRVNGRLTQAQGDARYVQKSDARSDIIFTTTKTILPTSESQHDSNPGYSISYFDPNELKGKLVKFMYYDTPVIGSGRHIGESGWQPYFGNGQVKYGRRGTHSRIAIAY